MTSRLVKPDDPLWFRALVLLVQLGVTIPLLVVGIGMLDSMDESNVKLGAGFVGTVVGYWLH